MAGPGQPEGTRRALSLAAVVGLIVAAIGGGYLLARNTGAQEASGTPSTGASSHTPSASPTTKSSTPSVSRTASPSRKPSTRLADGRYFVYAKHVKGGGTAKLTFDLAYLLTGPAANEAAAAHGDETPVPNGYYIVNDNPQLRTYPISPAATVRYIPTDASDQVALKPGSVDAWANAVNGTDMTNYRNGDAGWWIVILGGEITSIMQQYFP